MTMWMTLTMAHCIIYNMFMKSIEIAKNSGVASIRIVRPFSSANLRNNSFPTSLLLLLYIVLWGVSLNCNVRFIRSFSRNSPRCGKLLFLGLWPFLLSLGKSDTLTIVRPHDGNQNIYTHTHAHTLKHADSEVHTQPATSTHYCVEYIIGYTKTNSWITILSKLLLAIWFGSSTSNFSITYTWVE